MVRSSSATSSPSQEAGAPRYLPLLSPLLLLTQQQGLLLKRSLCKLIKLEFFLHKTGAFKHDIYLE